MLDGELIEREMLACLRERALELRRPHRGRLARARIDQVERGAIEALARDLNRIERLLHAVHPPELLERGIVERLHPERHAVHPCGAIAAKARRLDAGRIGLERHLDVGRDLPVLCHRVEHRAHG